MLCFKILFKNKGESGAHICSLTRCRNSEENSLELPVTELQMYTKYSGVHDMLCEHYY